MTYEGYGAIFKKTDFLKKHPEAYNATRLALTQLEQKGAISIEDTGILDQNNETNDYRVINAEILRQITQRENIPPSVTSICTSLLDNS